MTVFAVDIHDRSADEFHKMQQYIKMITAPGDIVLHDTWVNESVADFIKHQPEYTKIEGQIFLQTSINWMKTFYPSGDLMVFSDGLFEDKIIKRHFGRLDLLVMTPDDRHHNAVWDNFDTINSFEDCYDEQMVLQNIKCYSGDHDIIFARNQVFPHCFFCGYSEARSLAKQVLQRIRYRSAASDQGYLRHNPYG